MAVFLVDYRLLLSGGCVYNIKSTLPIVNRDYDE